MQSMNNMFLNMALVTDDSEYTFKHEIIQMIMF